MIVFVVYDENNIPSSNSVELKSGSNLSFGFLSNGYECMIVTKFLEFLTLPKKHL